MFGLLTKWLSTDKTPARRTRSSCPSALRLESLEFRDVPAVVGGLDPSFGTGGKVVAFSGVGSGGDAAVDSVGRTVVVGSVGTGSAEDFLVTRFNPDGTPDTTFGTGGKVTIDFGNDLDTAHAVAIDANDNVIVAGLSLAGGKNSMAFARLKAANGAPDPTFGGGGPAGTKLIPLTTGSTGVSDITLDKAGHIIAIGSEGVGGSFDFAVVRLLADGSAIDPAFNGGAVKAFDGAAGSADFGNGVALDGNGNIVGVGQSLAPNSEFAAFRLLANGTALDPAFNSGKVLLFTTTATTLNGAFSVAVDGANNVYLAGFSNDNAGTVSAAVAKLTAAGAHDPTFGNNGTAGVFTSTLAGVSKTSNNAADLIVRPDGRIIAAGSTQPTVGAPRDFAVFQLLPNGQLDPSFNATGPLPGIDAFDLGNNHDDRVGDKDGARHGLALDPEGRIVVGGWDATLANSAVEVARLMGTVEKGTDLAVGGSPNGKAAVFAPDPTTGKFPNTATATVAAFGAITADVRTAVGDVNGDGVPDTILVTGPGGPIRVAVVSGVDNHTLLVSPFDPFGGNFTGGGYVAAGDFDNNGRAEVVVTPDQGGGPRVAIFSLGADGQLASLANFFGIDDPNFRGGARVAVGDVNGDGHVDLAVTAGFGGGPRVALFDGRTVFTTPTRLVSDFFAFPGTDATTLRNGTFVAVGDVNGDGAADLIFGGGPGGAPRVFILSGTLVSAGNVTGAQTNPIANFFVAGNTADRGGVRVAATDADGDGKADLAVGSGEGDPSKVRVYLGKNFTTHSEPATFQDIDPFGATLTNGVFVG